MKRFCLLLLWATLAAICLSPLILGAPAPLPKPRKVVEPVPGRYLMTWGDSIPDDSKLYKDGGYGQTYTYNTWNWNPWLGGGEQIQKSDTYLGTWKWDRKTRILTLREEWCNGRLIMPSRVFTFKLAEGKLETEEPFPSGTSSVKLKLQPLKE